MGLDTGGGDRIMGRMSQDSVAALQRELKYVFSNHRARIFRDWLDVRCRPDPQFAAGRIFSVYFDTPGSTLLDEKINSDYLKTKVRLRWYGDWTSGRPAGNVFLEVKRRFGSTRKKFRQLLDWPAAEAAGRELSDPRLLEVNRLVAAAGFCFSGPLRPVVGIEYRRRRYLEPATGTRICLDHDIAAFRTHPALGPAGRRPPIADGVFEVKGTVERLPDTLAPLIALGCRRQSFSKFQRCLAPPEPGAPDEDLNTTRRNP